MKRIFAFFVVLLFCCSLCACGKLNISGEGLGLNVEGLKPNTENTDAGVAGSDEGTDKGTEGSGADLEVPGSRIEGPGYRSPEEAIVAYAAALKSADVSKILATYAVETYVENFKLEDYVQYYPTVSLGSIPMEGWNGLTEDFALVGRQNQIVEDVNNLCVTACFGYEYIADNWNIKLNSPETTDELLDELSGEGWAQILAEMEYDLDFKYIKDFYDEEAYTEILQKTATAFGCDEIVPIAIRTTINGTRYYLCMDVARYGDKWYNWRAPGCMQSCLMGDSYSGGIVPVE